MAGLYSASAQGQHDYGEPINKKTPIKSNNAKLPNIGPMIQAGINPKTGLPIKAENTSNTPGFKANNKKLLRIVDEQDALNRFTWYNLPASLSGNLIERILYYEGQGMFFYMETYKKFFFLPYALAGTIDVYGRYVDVTPLPFNGTANDGDDKKDNKKKKYPWITGLIKKCIYEMYSVNGEDVDKMSDEQVQEVMDTITDRMQNGCVLLHDYSCQMAQTNISRQVLNDPLLDVMADCIPFMHTALLNSTGIQGMRVQSEDEYSNVEAASRSINSAALTGKKYIPIVGNVDFQEMTGGNVGKSEEFLLALQAMDNYRLSLYGLENGGLFQKKSHMLEGEQQMNSGKASLIMQDGLTMRQNFCDLVNNIWGLGIWCDISEAALGIDRDMDGEVSDNDPQTTSTNGGEEYELSDEQ